MSSLAERLKASQAKSYSNRKPLWLGPESVGPYGGITFSMLSRWLVCRERFRVQYILGLAPPDRFNHRLGYGNMWHVCEEALAVDTGTGVPTERANLWRNSLIDYLGKQIDKYPMQAADIEKWGSVALVQFPVYVDFWSKHPDVMARTPIESEQVFCSPYELPSGRVVYLKGKRDSVDMVDGLLWLQENKTKGDLDEQAITRQMQFDLQTQMYLISLQEDVLRKCAPTNCRGIAGVRYNCVRRPLSGGKGSITMHKEKSNKQKRTFTPAETPEEFFNRLANDYIKAEPEYWFFRLNCEVSEHVIKRFEMECLIPILENLCWWYDEVTDRSAGGLPKWMANWRTPYGLYNPMSEGGETEYDEYLNSGSTANLVQHYELFPELRGD